MRKDCVFEGRCYSHGSTLQLFGDNMICNDGKWEKEFPKPGLNVAPGKDLSDL